MKKYILIVILIVNCFILKAQNALTIDASQLVSAASLDVIVYANDVNTYQTVGKTLPISISSLSGIVEIGLEDIEWDGTEPMGDWGWGYAEIKISCSTPAQSVTPNTCGSYNMDGIIVGYISYPHQDCFEAQTTTCGATNGDTVEGKMGNSGSERPTYPALIEIE